MSRVEDTLRSTFRERVAAPPSIENLAERAVAGARQVRRARTAFASVAAALCVALVGFGIASFAGGPGPRRVEPGPSGEGTIGTVPPPSVSPTSEPAALPIDVVVGDRLLLAGGGEISLTDLGIGACGSCWARGAWRVPDGWLASVYQINASDPDTSTLWHLSESGAATEVVTGEGIMMVSAGTDRWPGVKVAWVADGSLHMGTYADGDVLEAASTPAPTVEVDDQFGPRPLYPRAMAGGALVLAGTLTGGGLDFWDAWFPDRGDYAPAEYPGIGVYATTADGEHLIARSLRYPGTGSKETCLTELDPDGFASVRSQCPNPLGLDDAVVPSPDGHLWMTIGTQGVSLFDAEQVWSDAGPITTWGLPAGPGTDGWDGEWVDDESFVMTLRSGVHILYTDGRPDDIVPLPQPDQQPGPLGIVVDDLR